MQIDFINPYTNHPLTLMEDGLADESKVVFPKINGAYRIAGENNYAKNFGYQWNKFAATQIDKTANLNISKKRFFAETGWENEDLTGKTVLEVGSGAGRFSQIILDFTDAELYSVDYSNAVEANYKNNGPHPRLKLFQASIYELPFAPAQFDKVICLGVLQHTPEIEKSVQSLINTVKPGGELVVDFYPYKGWWTKMQAKYILRPFTKRMDHEKLYKKIDKNIDSLIKTYKLLSGLGFNKLNRFLPLCDINGTLPKNLPYPQLREMCVLDTFDMFSPEFDQPQKIKTITDYFKKYGMQNVWGGNIEYEGYKAAIVKGNKI